MTSLTTAFIAINSALVARVFRLSASSRVRPLGRAEKTLAARTSDSAGPGLADGAWERHMPRQLEVPMSIRPSLDQIGVGAGKKARLHRILYQNGLRNGTAIFLPYDHGLEHGPRDFSGNPESSDPKHIIRLALEGGFNGIAIQIGLARKFYWEYAGEVPLVLKLNGKTDIPLRDRPALAGEHDGRGGCPARRGRRRLHAVRRFSRPGAGFRAVPAGTRGRRAVRDAADRLVLPARRRDRRQGRQGLRSTRSTTPRGPPASWAPIWSR